MGSEPSTKVRSWPRRPFPRSIPSEVHGSWFLKPDASLAMKASPPTAVLASSRTPSECECCSPRGTPSSRLVLIIFPAFLGSLLASCTSSASPSSERQIARLQAIADLERDVSSFAASRNGIHAAEAHIGEGMAIVILTRADGEGISQHVVEEIVRYIGDRTGMSRERIVIKAKATAGGNSR
jgi:hypothetical protein